MKQIFTLCLLVLSLFSNAQRTFRWFGNGQATQTISTNSATNLFTPVNYREVINGVVSATEATSLPAGSILEISGVSLTITATSATGTAQTVTAPTNYVLIVRGGILPVADATYRNGQLSIGANLELRLPTGSEIRLRTFLYVGTNYFGTISLAADQKTAIFINNVKKAEGVNGGPASISSTSGTAVNAVTSASTSTNTNQFGGFASTGQGAIGLPVRLSGFNAVKANSKIILNWVTVQEINSDYFELQRSTDASKWTTVKIVKAAGNSSSVINYNAEDAAPTSGTVYYRLKMVDQDATFAYSNIARLSFAAANGKMFAYPNPASNYTVINSDKSLTGNIQVEVVNYVTGVRMMQQAFTNPGNSFRLNMSQLPAGNYVVRVYSEETLVQALKLAKF